MSGNLPGLKIDNESNLLRKGPEDEVLETHLKFY